MKKQNEVKNLFSISSIDTVITPNYRTRHVSTLLFTIMLSLFFLTVPLRAQEDTKKALDTLWNELKAKDRKKAKHALEELIDRKEKSVDFLSNKITLILKNEAPYKLTKKKEIPGKVKKQVENLVQKLGKKQYQIRMKATEELGSYCREYQDARSYLKMLQKKNNYVPEVEHLVNTVLSQTKEKLKALRQNKTRLRLCRTIRVLGEIGGDRAKKLLQKILQHTEYLPEHSIANSWRTFAGDHDWLIPMRHKHKSAQGAITKFITVNEFFRQNDTDGNGENDYWTWDVWGLYALNKPSSDGMVKMMPKKMAKADFRKGPSATTKMVSEWPTGPPEAYKGYFFTTFPFYGTGSNRTEYGKKSLTRFGYMAFPASYGRTGNYALIMQEDGVVYRIDAFLGGYNYLFGPPTSRPGTPPKKSCPENPKKSGYHPIK